MRLICRPLDERRPEAAPHERLISFVTDRPGHDWRYAIDATRMRRNSTGRQESFETGDRETAICAFGILKKLALGQLA